MSYSNITINDPNPVKRYLQRGRFKDAVSLFPSNSKNYSVLDFGGGDGELCMQLSKKYSTSNFVSYEPSPEMYNEAKEKISNNDKISLLSTIESIPTQTIDIIYSLEVFEHLPKEETTNAIVEIDRILKSGGTLIIGVPNELFLAALYKGIFRMFRRYGQFDALFTNIFKCVIGRPPQCRPIGEISPNNRYHFHHLGFDHRILSEKLTTTFSYCETIFSPFKFIGKWGSPEVYYIFKKD